MASTGSPPRGVSVRSASMKVLEPVLKNDLSKRVYAALGIRKPFSVQTSTSHYRMPDLVEAGGYLPLAADDGPEIPPEEWLSLEYVTYPTDPHTFFAPLTSATGENVLRGFWDDGKPDLDGIWTSNAEKAPTLRRYVESIGNRYGRVQLIRQEPNTTRRVPLEPPPRRQQPAQSREQRMGGADVARAKPRSHQRARAAPERVDRRGEVRIPLPRSAQAVVDSERLFHSGLNKGPATALCADHERREHAGTPGLDPRSSGLSALRPISATAACRASCRSPGDGGPSRHEVSQGTVDVSCERGYDTEVLLAS